MYQTLLSVLKALMNYLVALSSLSLSMATDLQTPSGLPALKALPNLEVSVSNLGKVYHSYTIHPDVSVDLVREFLTPHDRVTRTLAVTRYIKKPRADFTCEWFDRHLTDFTRGGKELMLVSGKPSTGKSVLSEWVVERLQASTGRRASEVVTYTIGRLSHHSEIRLKMC
jgi:hypothetical protein